MADESIEQIALEQRATDPRVSAPVVAPDPVVEPDLVADPVEPVEAVEPDSVVEPPAKPKRTAEEVLKGRVGHLTKIASERSQEVEDYKQRLAAAEALLAAGVDPLAIPPIAAKPVGYGTKAEFDAAVAAEADAKEFNRKADDLYNVGSGKFTDWKDAVDSLVVSGFMNKDLLDSAMAIEDGPAVLHYLGTNLDEAERIGALTPIRKAAEMAKLSATLGKPVSVPVSAAPAPIRPVSGSPSPTVDLQRIADTNDMRSYAAARAQQGARWAQGRGK